MNTFVGAFCFWMVGKVKVKSLSCARLFVTPRTMVYQAPPSMGFSRQGYWSGLSFPFPGDLPNPGIKPASPTSEPPGKSLHHRLVPISREGTQLQPSTENWTGFTGHGPTPQNKTQFPPQSSISSGTFHKPLVLLQQWQTDWKPQSQKTNQSNHMYHSFV